MTEPPPLPSAPGRLGCCCWLLSSELMEKAGAAAYLVKGKARQGRASVRRKMPLKLDHGLWQAWIDSSMGPTIKLGAI